MSVSNVDDARKAIDKAAERKDDKPRESASSRVVRLAQESGMEFFHDGDTAYATIQLGDVRQTWSMRSTSVRNWLARLAHQSDGRVPGSQALADALNVLCGCALYDGDDVSVHFRVAGLDNRIYLDLADDRWRAVEVDADGWRIDGLTGIINVGYAHHDSPSRRSPEP